MWKKPFNVKSKTNLKTSESKGFYERTIELFPNAKYLFEGKDQIQLVRVILANGNQVKIYLKDNIPLFFEKENSKDLPQSQSQHQSNYNSNNNERVGLKKAPKGEEGRLIPTIYSLAKIPDLIAVGIRTHKQLLSRLQDGADLMLPGITFDVLPQSQSQSQTQSHPDSNQTQNQTENTNPSSSSSSSSTPIIENIEESQSLKCCFYFLFIIIFYYF